MQTIAEKKQELLIKRKFDVGAAQAGEIKVRDHRNGGSGFTYQVFEKATIYAHPKLGTFEVHGSIRKRYDELGGPGNLEFGFPITDEGRTVEGYAVASLFEHGAIFAGYMPGPNAISIYGKLYEYWKATYKSFDSYIGYPLCDPFDLPNGEKGIFFENAFLFTINGQKDVIHFRYQGPLLGDPHITSSTALNISSAYTADIPKEKWTNLAPLLNQILDIASKKLALQYIPGGGTIPIKLELHTENVHLPFSTSIEKVRLNITSGAMNERQLFNIVVINNVNDIPGAIGLHAVYSKDKWENFSIIHATDLHVSYVNDYYYSAIKQSKFSETADKYFENFNDDFRDFIHYANKLHDDGRLDLILLTGDLVDYQNFSVEETKYNPFGNFLFFERMIKGNDKSPKTNTKTPELRVPIVTTLGNHDYRRLAYLLDFDVILDDNITLVSDTFLGNNSFTSLIADGTDEILSGIAKGVELIKGLFTGDSSITLYEKSEYSSFNLLKEETTVIYRDKDNKLIARPKLDSSRAVSCLLTQDPIYYKSRISSKSSNLTTLQLGKNAILNFNTGHDKGAPNSSSSKEQLILALNEEFGTGGENRQNLIGGSPNVEGITEAHLSELTTLLNDLNNTGAVIVTMHAPPINPIGANFSPYMRETDYPLRKTEEICNILNCSLDEAKVKYPDWINAIGHPFFKTGTIENFLDFGISKGLTDKFLEMCTGKGVNRSVDLVLSGHGHRNVEYRLGRTGDTIQYYMDFYTENPEYGYNTKLKSANDGKSVVKVQVNPNLISSYIPDPVAAHKTIAGQIKTFYWLMTRPYNDPLNSSKDSKAWWNNHRPLITQTAALGPIESCQRDDVDNADRIEETVFQGFRVIRIKDNIIDKIHYVKLKELRTNNYKMPWEDEYRPIEVRGTTPDRSGTAGHQIIVN